MKTMDDAQAAALLLRDGQPAIRTYCRHKLGYVSNRKRPTFVRTAAILAQISARLAQGPLNDGDLLAAITPGGRALLDQRCFDRKNHVRGPEPRICEACGKTVLARRHYASD